MFPYNVLLSKPLPKNTYQMSLIMAFSIKLAGWVLDDQVLHLKEKLS